MTIARVVDGVPELLPPNADVVYTVAVEGSENPQQTRASWATVNAWSENERNVVGLYTVVEVNAGLGPDKKHGSPVLVFEDGTVKSKRAAVNMTPPDIAARKDALKAYAAQVRWAKEQGGLTLPGGMAIKTDTEARVKIRELRDNLVSGTLTAPYRFKALSGWVTLDLATVQAVYAAVVQFVSACFATEDEVDAGIDAGTIKTEAVIDARFQA